MLEVLAEWATELPSTLVGSNQSRNNQEIISFMKKRFLFQKWMRRSLTASSEIKKLFLHGNLKKQKTDPLKIRQSLRHKLARIQQSQILSGQFILKLRSRVTSDPPLKSPNRDAQIKISLLTYIFHVFCSILRF